MAPAATVALSEKRMTSPAALFKPVMAMMLPSAPVLPLSPTVMVLAAVCVAMLMLPLAPLPVVM